MDKRAKSEQFRKRRNNYFQRGYEIGVTCDTDIFILFKRNGKFYTFTNMEEIELPTQEDIQRNLVASKTAADYETTYRTKNTASPANESNPFTPNTSSNVSSFSPLGITVPDPPELDLSSRSVCGCGKTSLHPRLTESCGFV